VQPPRVLETAVYVADVERSHRFYSEVLGLGTLLKTDRMVAMSAGEATVLLLFQRGGSDRPLSTPGGTVPGHGARGPQHFAFAITAEEVPRWVSRLLSANVDIESRVSWPGGGESLYFRDPDDHSVELATPGLWASY
jgi:catechol 2,3-dioxygenase-like lactoylglutathione lyase family enzyme